MKSEDCKHIHWKEVLSSDIAISITKAHQITGNCSPDIIINVSMGGKAVRKYVTFRHEFPKDQNEFAKYLAYAITRKAYEGIADTIAASLRELGAWYD